MEFEVCNCCVSKKPGGSVQVCLYVEEWKASMMPATHSHDYILSFSICAGLLKGLAGACRRITGQASSHCLADGGICGQCGEHRFRF